MTPEPALWNGRSRGPVSGGTSKKRRKKGSSSSGFCGPLLVDGAARGDVHHRRRDLLDHRRQRGHGRLADRRGHAAARAAAPAHERQAAKRCSAQGRLKRGSCRVNSSPQRPCASAGASAAAAEGTQPAARIALRRRPDPELASQAASTVMRRGCTCGRFGIATSSTPLICLALIASVLALSGSVKRRRNVPRRALDALVAVLGLLLLGAALAA